LGPQGEHKLGGGNLHSGWLRKRARTRGRRSNRHPGSEVFPKRRPVVQSRFVEIEHRMPFCFQPLEKFQAVSDFFENGLAAAILWIKNSVRAVPVNRKHA